MGLDIQICVNDVANDTLTQLVSSVEIYEKIDQNTTYQLNFMVDVIDGDIALQLETNTNPGQILSIMAQVNNDLICLVKGPVTQQEEFLQHGGAGSWLHVEGEDTGYNMDLTVNFVQSTSATDADIVTTILSNNNQMTADVDATPDSTHDEDNHSFIQRETDLSVIRSLARRNGFHFWITYSNTGDATGHFKSRSLDDAPSADLIINFDNYNITSLRVSSDPRRPSQTQGSQLDLHTKNIISDTVTLDDTLLGTDGLAALEANNIQSSYLAPTVDDSGAMQARSIGALREAQWFINATCKTTLDQLGSIIRYHTIVDIQGAGTRHSGNYYVSGVKHTIDAANYTMDLELSRNAWGDDDSSSTGTTGSIF